MSSTDPLAEPAGAGMTTGLDGAACGERLVAGEWPS
jgi:hypothetical protein